MKGFESVIQGYAEGGSVSSNPFEAYARSSLANPFAGLMNLPARPQYVPRAATPTTTSPLRGYMDIYGNLAAIREEQARRRAAAAPAPQPDQPSQGSEPTTGPAPTPDPDLTLRDIETTVPVDPDFSDITSLDAGRADEASIPTAPTAPSPEDLGLPGFDEAQPVIPPGLGFDSIPAPDLILPVTREDLPPPEAMPVVDPGEVFSDLPPTNPLQDILVDGTLPEPIQDAPAQEIAEATPEISEDKITPTDDYSKSVVPSNDDLIPVTQPIPVVPSRQIETTIEDYDLPSAFDDVAAMPVFDPDAVEVGAMPAEIEAIAPPSNPLQDILVDGTLPDATQEVPTYDLGRVLGSYSDDAYATPPEMTEVAQAPENVDVDVVLGDTASDVLSGASKDESAKAPEKSTLADLAKAVFSGIGTTSPLGLANMLGGMAATQALKGEEAAPMSLTQMAKEKIAPSMPTLFELSPAAKQEMVDRGNLAGNQMAEAVAQGQISKDAAATALTNDINLVGSLGHALAALEAGTKAMQGTEDTDLALSPGDSSDGESGESDTGTAPSTDVGPPSGFDGGFGSGFDFGGYDGGGYDGGGSDSDSGGGGGSESEGSSGGSESDGGGWAEGGYIPGDSGGMDDDVPALIDGKEPAKLSSGEFVFDAATVAALGDGNNEAGAKKLNMLREAIRKKAYGHKKQPPKNFSVGDLVRLYDRMR